MVRAKTVLVVRDAPEVKVPVGAVPPVRDVAPVETVRAAAAVYALALAGEPVAARGPAVVKDAEVVASQAATEPAGVRVVAVAAGTRA